MKYRTFGTTITPHGSRKVLVHSQRSGTTRLLAPAEVHLLRACDTFRTLHDHAARNWLIVRAMAYASGADTGHAGASDAMASVQRQLQGFVDDGFLVSDAGLHEEIRALCRQAEDAEEAANTITSIGIPTRDRPESLRRALASYTENTTRFGRAPDCTVIDDSREADTQALNKEGLRAVQRHYGGRIRYANREERARFAGELARSIGIPEDIPRFALLGDTRCGKTYGGCRNALLLDAAGALTVQADDDTVCRLAAAPGAETGLTLTSRTDANELWFFERFDEAQAFAPEIEEDFLGLHEQLLGRRLTDCIGTVAAAGDDLDVREIEPRFLDSMRLPEAKVAVSFVGTAGDSGAQYPFRFLHGGRTFDRLVATEHAYRLGMTTRQMVKVTPRPSISDGAYCMTTNIGLDHRALLPPFMPVMRNEDGIFGSLLSGLFAGSYTGYLPCVVLHSPPEARTLAADAHRIRHKAFLTNGLLTWIIRSFFSHPAGPDPARNIRALGRSLQELGTLPLEPFADFLRATAWRAMQSNVVYAEQRLEALSAAPAYWKDDVRAYLRVVAEAVVQPDFFIPSDLEGRAAEKLALFQDLVYKFGELLVYWPALVEAAGALRARGDRLATTL